MSKCQTCKYWVPTEPGVLQEAIDNYMSTNYAVDTTQPWGKCCNSKFKSIAVAHLEQGYMTSLALFFFKVCVFQPDLAEYLLATQAHYSCAFYQEEYSYA